MTNPDDITLFSAVDRTKEPDFFKRFLDEGNKLPGIIASKPIILGGLQLTGAETALDVGCGLGDDTLELARLVSKGGRAVGVDVSQSMIDAARDRAAAQHLSVEFDVCDAQALPFADATFDACRTAHSRDGDRPVQPMVITVSRGS
jgi:SAM-dependent methyltransferase